MNRQLVFFASCDMGNFLVVMDEIGRRIFEVEKKSGKSRCVAELENMGVGRILYQCAEKYRDKIFFFPFTINDAPIIVYYYKEQRVEYINLQEKSKEVDGGYQLAQRIDNTVWIFPVSIADSLLVFHMDSEETESIEAWSPMMGKIQLDYGDNYSKVGDMVEVEGMLYQTVVKTNMVIGIRKKDYKVSIYTLPEKIKLFRSMDYDGSNFWIPDMQNQVIEWNPKQGIRNIFPIDSGEGRQSKWIILCGRKYIWLLPYQQERRIIQIKYDTGESRIIDIFPDCFVYDLESTKRIFGQMHKNKSIIDIYPFNGNLVVHIDLENDNILKRHETIMLPEEWSDEFIIKYELKSQFELNRISPSHYLQVFLESMQKKEGIKVSQTYGKKIWENVVQQL